MEVKRISEPGNESVALYVVTDKDGGSKEHSVKTLPKVGDALPNTNYVVDAVYVTGFQYRAGEPTSRLYAVVTYEEKIPELMLYSKFTQSGRVYMTTCIRKDNLYRCGDLQDEELTVTMRLVGESQKPKTYDGYPVE